VLRFQSINALLVQGGIFFPDYELNLCVHKQSFFCVDNERLG
jgi:hypothetical protein